MQYEVGKDSKEPYEFSGRVIEGAQLGRQWGIPTANLDMANRPLPFTGVFCVKVEFGNRELIGVANLGSRPTVNGLNPVLEVYIFEFNENIYNENIKVIFLHKLRDEVKFPNVEALIAQIRQDIQNAKDYFGMDST
ncbi:riboflavin kinase [Legionella quinlivanii]|uniref:riboflavin kinase n=1 Tax=Legionella quinlivanii TaxID=45073 RepID=UPI0022435C41|nr:riboflavin kinase [Legionella quinlivanii]MCW8450752.1 riboflavin kinase [Legionella quinlivanii]